MGGINKKEYIKEILKQLSQGLTPQEAKEKLKKDVGSIESSELFSIEQELINEGISPDEIKRFCNVHALLFEGMFENKVSDSSNPSHPVNLFKAENREIEKLVEKAKAELSKNNISGFKDILIELSKIDIHFQRKEQILFPYLERQNFFGPSKVMWAKDDEIRQMLKQAISSAENPDKDYVEKYAMPLLEEILSMIYKEENILFPTSLEKLKPSDWVEIFKQSASLGYVFIKPPAEVFEAEDLNKRANLNCEFKDGYINFPTGKVKLEDLRVILNTLPVDITFIDKENKVAYFSHSKDRIFLRTPSVIGRDVENCHPPKSIEMVKKVIEDLKEGRKQSHDFWLNLKGRLIYIRYFAVRNEFGEYLGILEVTQDITEIKKIEGEKRLI